MNQPDAVSQTLNCVVCLQLGWDSPGCHHRRHDTCEILPPCVCHESSQSWRLNGIETSELLCQWNTRTLISSSTRLNNWRWSNICRPFGLMSQTQVVTQVWVTQHDLPLWVTWQSTSCPMRVEYKEQSCDGYVPTCVWSNTKNSVGGPKCYRFLRSK